MDNQEEKLKRREERRERNRRKRRRIQIIRICGMASIVLAIFLVGILVIKKLSNKEKIVEPSGTYVEVEEAERLFHILEEKQSGASFDECEKKYSLDGYKGSLCLGALDTFYEQNSFGDRQDVAALSAKYFGDQEGENSRILLSEFYDFYIELFTMLNPDSNLHFEDLVPFGKGSIVYLEAPETCDEDAFLCGNITEETLVSAKQLSFYKFDDGFDQKKIWDEDAWFLSKKCLVDGSGNIIADITELLNEELEMAFHNQYELTAAFVASNTDHKMELWLGKYCINVAYKDEIKDIEGNDYSSFEDIVDLYVNNEKQISIKTYQNKVSGKLLRVGNGEIELEGQEGNQILNYPEDGIMVYKVFGEREIYSMKNLILGYDFDDFVLDDSGNVVAALATREDKMDTIRVVIKDSELKSAFHSSLTVRGTGITYINDVSCDGGTNIYLEKSEDGKNVIAKREDGSVITTSNRIKVIPSANTDKVAVTSISRANGTPYYNGKMECFATEEGLVLINEVLLETYLYYVVPSEMPASYPDESLKAQAISARTYAYSRMEKSNLAKYGAHVDDSAACQVYNNIDSAESTCLAVRNTSGKVITYNGELADIYYYSTSCGVGTDLSAWHGSGLPYLKAKKISSKTEDAAEILKDEDTFRGFINGVDSTDYECEEAWYRWTYDTNLNVSRLNSNLLSKYESGPQYIYVLINDEYVNEKPLTYTYITDIQVVARTSGGVMDEIVITGDAGSMKVVGENAIRTVLANDKTKVIRQDGSEGPASSLLPSGFAYIDCNKDENGIVTGYHMRGGGFGHGIGLSQNGAKDMAKAGCKAEDIIKFFYDGSEITEE